MLATGALVLPLGLVVALGGAASAARSHPTGTGLVKCTKIKGTITFSPPLVNGGTAAETTTVSASASHCSGGTPNPSKVSSTATITGSTNSCAGLATASPPTILGTYTPNTISPSSTSGGTETLITSPKLGFTINGATTTGSFPSTTTDISVSTSETLTKFNAACAKAAGVKTLKIKSGSVTDL